MNSIQDSKLNMYTTVLKQFSGEGGAGLVNRKGSTSALSKVIEALTGKVEAIRNVQKLQVAAISGITQDKSALRASLVSTTAALAAGVFAYASEIGNNMIKEKVNYSTSDLNRAKHDQLQAIAKLVIEVASEQLADLEAYGINAVAVQLVQDNLNQFLSASPSPRDAIGKRVSYRKSLTQLFRETDDLVKNRFDKIMQTIALTDPDSINNYRSNRSIVSAPVTHTQLKGRITSAEAPKGLGNVSVHLVETGNSMTTTSKGIFNFKELASGKYTLRISADGYHDVLLSEVDIKQGSLNNQAIRLTKK